MVNPERALSPEEMGLSEEDQKIEKPKLTLVKGENKEAMTQGYSEQDARNLEAGIKSLVEQGLLNSNLAEKQIQDIWSKTSRVVEPGSDRDRFAAKGEIGDEVQDPIPEKADILGKEYERLIKYDDIPAMFETLDETSEMGLLDNNEIKRQKLELVTKLQEQTGWRLLENENLQKILTEQKFKKDEVKAVIDNVKESYNPSSDRWTAARKFEESEKAAAAQLVTPEDAKREKLQIIDGVESSVGINLSGARELLEKDQLNAEEFEAMVMDAAGKGSEEERRKAERKRLDVQPLKISNLERDGMNEAINQQLENYQNLINARQVNKEEAKILAKKREKMLDLRKEIELNYDVVDVRNIPNLVRTGELSADRALDMMGDDLERSQKTAQEIEKAVRQKEKLIEESSLIRGYRLIDQLNAAGKIDFKAEDLSNLKNEISDLRSRLDQGKKTKQARGIFGRMGDYFRTRFTEKGKQEEQAWSADQKKFAQLLQQRAEMENKFWSVAQMPAEDQDKLVKYNIFERKQTKEEDEAANLQVYPQQVEAVMRDIYAGKTDPALGLEKIKKFREIAEKRAEEFAYQEFDADQVKKASDLIEQLNSKNIISFNKENFLEALARTRSEFTPPAEKVKAREKLLAMEMEIYQSINKISLSELGDALKAFRQQE